MNDFKKEELEKLRYAIAYYDYSDDELNNKIQSMIDNYCKHNWESTFDERAYSSCTECGEKGI